MALRKIRGKIRVFRSHIGSRGLTSKQARQGEGSCLDQLDLTIILVGDDRSLFLLDIASLAAVKGASQKILATLTSQPQSGVTVCQQVAGANGCVDSTRTIFGIQGSAWHVINSQQIRTPCQDAYSRQSSHSGVPLYKQNVYWGNWEIYDMIYTRLLRTRVLEHLHYK